MDGGNLIDGEGLPQEWYSQKEELSALKSIYSGDGECVLTSPTKDITTVSFDELLDKEVLPPRSSCLWPLILNINLPLQTSSSCHFNLSVTFQLDRTYPNVSPQILSIKSDKLTEACLSSLKRRGELFAASLQPEPCLFDILEWLKDSVCDITLTENDFIRRELLFDDVTTTAAICNDTKGTSNPYNNASIAYSISDQFTTANPPSGATTATLLNPSKEETPALKGHTKFSESTMYTPEVKEPICQAGNSRTLEVTTSPSSVLCIVKLDHMRNGHKYFKLLNSWAKELEIRGKLFNCGVHSIYVVTTGSNNSLSEFLRRWKTQNVDVDSQGKPCKEKMMRILCQEMLKPLTGLSKRSHRSCGLDMIHCSKSDLLEHLNDDVEIQGVLKNYV